MYREGLDLFFKVLFSVIGFLCLYIFNDITNNMEKMSHSINELNTKMALVISNNKTLKEQKEDHEERIRDLERRINEARK